MLNLFCQNCNELVSATPLETPARDAIGICPVCGAGLSAHRYIAPGTIINGFQIEHEIGRGGMGVVYLARQLNLDRPVALKVLSDEMASDEAFVLAFFREARAAAALNHPNIVQAFDAGVAPQNVYYFVMELIDGTNLEVYTAENGALDMELAFQCAISIADALTYAWNAKSLAHRDIKPENIIWKDNNVFKLADLGLAKDYRESSISADEEMMATPAYASPEVIRGQSDKIGFKSDMYSFGATLYQLFSGRAPFEGNDPMEVCAKQLNEQPRPLIGLKPDVPSRLSMLLDKLMEKLPEKRPEKWEDVLEELKQLYDRWRLSQEMPEAFKKKKGAKPPQKKVAAPAARKKAKSAASLPNYPQKQSSSAPVVIIVLLVLAALGIGGYAWFTFNGEEKAEVKAVESSVIPDNMPESPAEKGSDIEKDWDKFLNSLPGNFRQLTAYERWGILEKFRKGHAGQELPDEAKLLYANSDKAMNEFREEFEEYYKPVRNCMQGDPEDIDSFAQIELLQENIAKILDMAAKYPDWLPEDFTEKTITACGEFKKKLPELQWKLQQTAKADEKRDDEERRKNLAEQRAVLQKNKVLDLRNLCQNLVKSDMDSASQQISDFEEKYSDLLTDSDRTVLSKLTAALPYICASLNTMMEQNRKYLKGVELFPTALPKYTFLRNKNDYMYCELKIQAGTSTYQKFPWTELAKYRKKLIEDIFQNSQTAAYFDPDSQVKLLVQAKLLMSSMDSDEFETMCLDDNGIDSKIYRKAEKIWQQIPGSGSRSGK